MKTVYSKLIPTEEYGEFLLSFTCQKCSENNAVVLKITNEEGFEYLQQRCEKCGELHRVYAINGSHKGTIFPAFVHYDLEEFEKVLTKRKVKSICGYTTDLTLNEWFNGSIGELGQSEKILKDLKARAYEHPVRFSVDENGMFCQQFYKGFKGITAVAFKDITNVYSTLNYFFIVTYTKFTRNIAVIEME